MTRYIVLPMGEAAGVGPELIVKALLSDERVNYGPLTVVGDRAVFNKLSRDLRLPLPFTSYVETDEELLDALRRGEDTVFYHHQCIDMDFFEYSKADAVTGRACYECTRKAVSLIQNALATVLVTVPLDERALALAGYDTVRYETMVSDFASCQRGLTMLDVNGVRIFSHTHHMRLRDALDTITYEKILDTIIKVDSLTQDRKIFNSDKPLAIATVNPHHADSLTWDEEERDAIIPAIRSARDIGINITGPVGADHLMHRAAKGQYRAVIALFHDQAHIAAMSMDYEHTVTVNWGWPFLAVRVDRGARLDRAGQGSMIPVSLIQALKVARQYIEMGVES